MAAILCLASSPVVAGERSAAEAAIAPVIGGLSLAPPQWRYQPRPAAVAVGPALPESDSGPGYPVSLGLGTLDAGYVPDRLSFVNTLRARRGLSLLTLWEGAGRCLFFGIDERGRAGINFVRLRHPARRSDPRWDAERRYAELMGQPHATFPEPPRLFPH